jgi:hypothetical protein
MFRRAFSCTRAVALSPRARQTAREADRGQRTTPWVDSGIDVKAGISSTGTMMTGSQSITPDGGQRTGKISSAHSLERLVTLCRIGVSAPTHEHF